MVSFRHARRALSSRALLRRPARGGLVRRARDHAAVACGVIGTLAAGAYDFALAVVVGPLDEVSVVGTEGAAGAVLWVLWLLGLSPLYALGTLVVGAAVYQVLVHLVVGPRNAGYGETLRVGPTSRRSP